MMDCNMIYKVSPELAYWPMVNDEGAWRRRQPLCLPAYSHPVAHHAGPTTSHPPPWIPAHYLHHPQSPVWGPLPVCLPQHPHAALCPTTGRHGNHLQGQHVGGCPRHGSSTSADASEFVPRTSNNPTHVDLNMGMPQDHRVCGHDLMSEGRPFTPRGMPCPMHYHSHMQSPQLSDDSLVSERSHSRLPQANRSLISQSGHSDSEHELLSFMDVSQHFITKTLSSNERSLMQKKPVVPSRKKSRTTKQSVACGGEVDLLSCAMAEVGVTSSSDPQVTHTTSPTRTNDTTIDLGSLFNNVETLTEVDFQLSQALIEKSLSSDTISVSGDEMVHVTPEVLVDASKVIYNDVHMYQAKLQAEMDQSEGKFLSSLASNWTSDIDVESVPVAHEETVISSPCAGDPLCYTVQVDDDLASHCMSDTNSVTIDTLLESLDKLDVPGTLPVKSNSSEEWLALGNVPYKAIHSNKAPKGRRPKKDTRASGKTTKPKLLKRKREKDATEIGQSRKKRQLPELVKSACCLLNESSSDDEVKNLVSFLNMQCPFLPAI